MDMSLTPAPSAPATPPALPPVRKFPPGRKAEVPSEYYSQGHEAFFTLPADVRAKFSALGRSKISQGLAPDAQTVIACLDVGIDPRLFRLPGTRKTAEGSPLHGGGNLSAWNRQPLLATTEIGKAIMAVAPNVTQEILAAKMKVSAQRLRGFLANLAQPTIGEASRATELGIPLGLWAEPDEAKRAARKAEREARKAAKAAGTPAGTVTP